MSDDHKRFIHWVGLIGWIVFSFSASISGILVSTDGWYTELNKPSWNPPGWLFGPVWSVLYVMMGIAAWRVWRNGGWKLQAKPLGLFLAQWVLNALWTPIFFGLQQPGWAFAEIMILLVFIRATMKSFARVDQGAAFILFPYLLWVGFAATLNLTIWRMN